jgi:hypothetical protein
MIAIAPKHGSSYARRNKKLGGQMDDAKKQIEELVEKFDGYLKMADVVVTMAPVFLEKIRETEITEAAGVILDKAFSEVMWLFRPLIRRWDNWQKDRIEWLAKRVKDMTEDGGLDEETAIEILKIHQTAVAHGFRYVESNFWENRAKSLQHKLEATTSTEKALSNLISKFPWKR